MKERCLPKDSKSGESRSGAEASLVQNNWLNRCGNALWNRPVSQKPTTIPGQTWCAATPASPSTCGSSSESCCSSHTTTAAASAGLTKRKVRPHGHVTDWRKPRFPHLSRVRTFRKRPDAVSFLEGWRQSDCKNLVEEKKKTDYLIKFLNSSIQRNLQNRRLRSRCQTVGHQEEPACHELWQTQPLHTSVLQEGHHSEARCVSQTGVPVRPPCITGHENGHVQDMLDIRDVQ